MPSADRPHTVSAECVNAILAAAGRSEPASPEAIDGLREWLSAAMERAIWRAVQPPLTNDEITALETAYTNLRILSDPLRYREDPPPRLNGRAWQEWFAARSAERKRGPRGKFDWALIGELLAIYELTSGEKASAKVPNYDSFDVPTIKFLKAALRALKSETPTNLKIRLHVPSAVSVRNELRDLRDYEILTAKVSLAPWIEMAWNSNSPNSG